VKKVSLCDDNSDANLLITQPTIKIEIWYQ
jgi:hypothetical protein